MVVINRLAIVILLLTLGFSAAKASETDELQLGMFKGRKLSQLPDNYREINSPAKLEKFRKSLEIVPKNAVITKIDGQTYSCEDRGGHDLENGMQVVDSRCWKKQPI
jgi:hypothetical protein